MTRYRIIETHADIAEGAAALRAACPHIRKVIAATGDPPLRRRENGFAGLARIVAGQQLSVASATAIWARLEAAVRPMEPAVLLRKRARTLSGCGLSEAKIATLRGIAEEIAQGRLDLAALARAEEEAVRERLTALKGVGPWTADIYLMFCLGRADAWAPGDLALRYAVGDATGRQALPDAVEMIAIAEVWRPWRGVAARALWAWYALRRAQKSAGPA